MYYMTCGDSWGLKIVPIEHFCQKIGYAYYLKKEDFCMEIKTVCYEIEFICCSIVCCRNDFLYEQDEKGEFCKECKSHYSEVAAGQNHENVFRHSQRINGD